MDETFEIEWTTNVTVTYRARFTVTELADAIDRNFDRAKFIHRYRAGEPLADILSEYGSLTEFEDSNTERRYDVDMREIDTVELVDESPCCIATVTSGGRDEHVPGCSG